MIYCYYGALVGSVILTFGITKLGWGPGPKVRRGEVVMPKKSIGRTAVGTIIDIAK